MKKNMINTCHIEGILYEHDLTLKESGPNSKNPGTPFISGTVSIATDDKLTNIVPIHYTYVTATTGRGNANASFTVLNNIVNGTYKTYMDDPNHAAKLRADTAIGLNEFYTDRNGQEELVSAKRNEGGFIHVTDTLIDDENARCKFKCDMVITGTIRHEADPDRDLEERMTIKGAIFDFRNSLLPIEFTAVKPGAMDYYESLEASSKNPVFTQLWGKQISTTTHREIKTESASWGEDDVRVVPTSRKDFVITGGLGELPLQDDESTLTWSELKEAMGKREVDLAAMKQRQAEYRASRTAAPIAKGAIPTPPQDDFKF